MPECPSRRTRVLAGLIGPLWRTGLALAGDDFEQLARRLPDIRAGTDDERAELGIGPGVIALSEEETCQRQTIVLSRRRHLNRPSEGCAEPSRSPVAICA